MITFITSMILLVLGYLIYGRFVDKTFKPNETKETPAHTMEDGVDFVPMNSNKNAFKPTKINNTLKKVTIELCL